MAVSSSEHSSNSSTSHQALRRYHLVPTPPPPIQPHQKSISNHKKHHRKHHRHHHDSEGAVNSKTSYEEQKQSRNILPDIHKGRRIVPYLNIYNMKETDEEIGLPPNPPPLTDRAIYDRADEKQKRLKKKRMVAQSVDYTSLRRHFASVDIHQAPSIRSDPPVHEEFVMDSVPLIVNNTEAIHKQLFHEKRKETRKAEKKKAAKQVLPPVEEVVQEEEENEPMVINRMFARGVFGVH